MTDEKKSKIIGYAVIIIIIIGIGIMLIISKNMNKITNYDTTTTTEKTETTITTTKKVEDDSSFRMVIEDVFSINNGISVTGTINQGTIHKGDKIEILGDNKLITAVIDKLYIKEKEIESATKGEYVAIQIKDINKSQVSRGQMVATPSTIEATNRFKAQIYINTSKEGGNDRPIYNNYNSSFVFKIESYNGTVILNDDNEVINPGETKEVTIELDTTVAMEKDTTFSIRENGREIGTGIVTELIK